MSRVSEVPNWATPNLLFQPDDIAWLFDTHLKAFPHLRDACKSFVVWGHEDCPAKVEIYPIRSPLHTDKPSHTFLMDAEYPFNLLEVSR